MQKRLSSLELYRIVLMILIIAHHYVVNSGLIDYIYSKPISINSVFLSVFGAWGKIGINCFVLITGFFMYNKKITLKKFLKLLLQVLFYNVIISSIFLITNYHGFSLRDFFTSVFMITDFSKCFTICFLIFYLLIPFLNVLIKNLNKKSHFILILIILLVFSILGSVISISFNYISWFCVVYIIGAYLAKYMQEKKVNWNLFSFLSILLSILSVIIGLYLSHKTDKHLVYYLVTDSNKILAVITSICLFMQFKNMNIKHNKTINYISESIFGVLLIHANNDAMRQFIWNDVLKNTSMFNSELLIVHAILSVMCIFIICVIIDKVRIIIIEKPFFKLINKKIDKIDLRIAKCLE